MKFFSARCAAMLVAVLVSAQAHALGLSDLSSKDAVAGLKAASHTH